jgi:hypothetical protein
MKRFQPLAYSEGIDLSQSIGDVSLLLGWRRIVCGLCYHKPDLLINFLKEAP